MSQTQNGRLSRAYIRVDGQHNSAQQQPSTAYRAGRSTASAYHPIGATFAASPLAADCEARI